MQNFCITKDDIFNTLDLVKKNSEQTYLETIRDIIKKDPFNGHKFYIYQFIKRIDDISGIKKMYHQARLTKPEPMPETTLLRVDPKDQNTITVIWTLPSEEHFSLYKKDKMFSDPFVFECIQKYLNNPRELMKRENGDLDEDEIKSIYLSMAKKK